MVSVAILSGWPRFAVIQIITFLCITRPSEARLATRKDIVLPYDALEDLEESSALLIQFTAAKTRRRGARIQYSQMRYTAEISFIQAIICLLPLQERIFDFSAHVYRSFWDKVLAILLVPKELKFTPACSRAGGAVHAFGNGTNIPDLMWTMRVSSQSTLSHYLQEVVALNSLKKLSNESRERVRLFASFYKVALKSTCTSKTL
jgi:hypothetical protein